MIVLHRRGTTGEWQQADLLAAQLPEVLLKDGEFAIEEREDGTRWVKVGDGKTKFAKLPYIDERAAAQLSAKLDNTTDELQKKIIELDTVHKRQLASVKQALVSKIADNADELTEAFKMQDAVVLAEAKQHISTETNSIRNELSDQAAASATVIDNEIKPAIAAVERKLNNSTATLTALAKQNKAAIAELESSVEETRAADNAKIDTRLVELSNSIEHKAAKLESAFTKRVEETEISLEELVEQTNRKQSNSVSAVKGVLEKQISDSEKTLTEKLAGLKADLEAIDTKTDSSLSNHAAQNEKLFSDIVNQLTALKEKAKTLESADKTLVNLIYEVDNTLTAVINKIAGELSALATKHDSDNANVVNELRAQNEASVKADSEILATLSEHVKKIYAEIADLVDDDILILEKAFSVENTLSARIRKLEENAIDNLEQLVEDKILVTKAELTKNIEEASNSLYENVENLRSNTNLKFTSTQKLIDAIDVAIQELQNRFSDQLHNISSEVTANKEETDAAIHSIEEQVAVTNSRIDATNIEVENQSKRISNLIALEPGSTTGDAELIDIRDGYNGITHLSAGDAVRAIGNDLEALKNSLPDYIPSNAVDGLLYENNQLYLTSKGETVGDPVEITGGGGGSGSVSVVKVINNLATNTLAVAKGNAALLDFTYTSFENGAATGSGTAYISINNKQIDHLSCTVQHGEAKRIDVAEYLKVGANTVKITCYDQYGASRSLVYNVSVIELRIESSFDTTNIFSDTITFRYKVYGQIEKTAHILIDGKEFSSKKVSASVSGSETTLILPKQKHGCHKITAYLTATINGTELPSNILEYEIICIEEGENAALIASVYSIATATQGDLISIPYVVYDPLSITSDINLIIYSRVAGERIEIDRQPITVGRTQQFWNTRKYPNGIVEFTISYTYNLYGEQTTVTKSHTLTITELDADVYPEEDSLQLYLTAQGRSNNEQNPAVWTFTQEPDGDKTYDTVTTHFEGFNWTSNGWITDTAGDTCLRLNGDARAIINFKPFAEDFKADGKTIEFEFVVRDVNNRDAIVIDCFDGDRGFRATPDTAFLRSSGTEVSCRYKDNERIRVAITVEHSETTSRFVSIYLDGVLSGIQRYTDIDNFQQNNPLNITLGSSLCGLDIYNIRIYNKALSAAAALNNYIADQTIPATRLQLMTDNDILENDKVSYDRVKALGQIPIITFTGPMPTYKGDKKKKTTRMKFEDPAHPEMNFDVLLDQIDVQGTSSQFYIRKNWKVKLPEARAHMPGAIPAKVFCIKVDYAEATGTHNTGAANFVETLYDRAEVTLPPQKDDTRVRTTIQGFPIIIFEKETEDSEPVFSSKGNFNYDKDAENAFGFTEDYEAYGVECWEFCNNTSDPVNFAGEIPADWLEDFEPRYAPKSANFERIEELKEVEELAASGKGIMTEAQRNELATLMEECIANFKEMHDWVLSTATYTLVDGKRVDITPTALAGPVTYGETTYTEDNEEYRLAKFKYEFKDHFNMHYSSMYYVFTFFALMTDQRAKNMFLTRWKDDDGTHRWYPYFYDNDTIFGINNEGALVFDYFHEDTDQLGSSNVFNGQNSVLWNNFRLCFPKEIEDTYSELRSSGKLTYSKIIEQFVTSGSDKWSAAIYNADADYKYVSMAREHVAHKDEDGNEVTGIDASNLYQVRGPGEHHLRYFIDNRINYCDSKWYAGNYPSDDIFLRIYTPKPADKATQEEIDRINASLAAVPANPAITITPFSDMYAGVRYKSGTLQQQRLKAGESFTFRPLNENETFGDTETAIYGAGEISSLGDLSGLYCGVINLSNAAKLTELTVGNANPAYYNDNFREISVGSNRLLRYIDLRNCSGLGIAGENPQKTLELSGCPNIEYIYTEGTNLTSVDLPTSGYIKVLHLPASINTLVIRNQHYLYQRSGTAGAEDFRDGLYVEDYKNIKTLCIENCPNINTNEILECCRNSEGSYTVERVRLTGIKWGTADSPLENADFIKSLFSLRGIDAKNNNLDDAYLVGSCYIDKLTGDEYAEIKSHYPYLEIGYNEMTSTVVFMSADSNTELYRVSVTGKNSAAPNCDDPVLANKIDKPVKESSAEFDYEWNGWARKPDEDKQADALMFIAGDRVLYPTFSKTRRKYEVKFINPTVKDNNVLQVSLTEYGNDAIYTGETPIKQDTLSPEIYTFIGWQPSPEKITGQTVCYAQFTILDETWYTIGIGDITNCVGSNGVIFDGYTLNESNSTVAITECTNNFNAAVIVPSTITFGTDAYTVNKLGGFSGHDKLEFIRLPETLTELLENAFSSCVNLTEITLPQSLVRISGRALQACTKLKEITIPAGVTYIADAALSECVNLERIVVAENNARYKIEQDCLIDTTGKKLVQGLVTSKIPQDGSVTNLGQYCFASMPITSIEIPEYITVIPDNAFSRCSALQEVKLPNTIKTLGATCFAWCSSLANIDLPEGLANILTYVFYLCPMEEIVIPSSINNIYSMAFCEAPNLTTVTFKKALESDGTTVKVPFIHSNAFYGTGKENAPVVFNCPWSEEQHKARFEGFDEAEKKEKDPTFGANYYVFNFDYEEEAN